MAADFGMRPSSDRGESGKDGTVLQQTRLTLEYCRTLSLSLRHGAKCAIEFRISERVEIKSFGEACKLAFPTLVSA